MDFFLRKMFSRQGIAACLFLLAGIAGCAHGPAAPRALQPADLYGRWQIVPTPQLPMPPACLSVSYEFTPDSITMRSGELELVAGYRREESETGLVFIQSGITHNGRQNCQGVPGDYVASHYEPRLEVDLVDGRLRLHLYGRGKGPFAEFVRMPAR